MDDLSQENLIGKVAVLEIEIADKRECISALQRTISDLRASQDQAIAVAVRNVEIEHSKLRDEFERRINMNLRMIDKLTSDKQELTRQLELCTQEICNIRQKCELRVKEAVEETLRNSEKAKKQVIVQERIKREQWEKEKEDEIKEKTVKALEPQIDLILSEQRSQKRQLELKMAEEKADLEKKYTEKITSLIAQTREDCRREAQNEIDNLRNQTMEREAQLREHHETILQRQREDFYRRLSEEQLKYEEEILNFKNSYKLQTDKSLEMAQNWRQNEIDMLQAEKHKTVTEYTKKLKALEAEKKEVEVTVRRALMKEFAMQVKDAEERAEHIRNEQMAALAKKLAVSAESMLEVESGKHTNELSRVKGQFERKIRGLEAELKEKQGDMSGFQKNYTDMLSENSRLVSELEDAAKTLKSFDEERKSMQDEVDRLKKNQEAQLSEHRMTWEQERKDAERKKDLELEEMRAMLEESRKKVFELELLLESERGSSSKTISMWTSKVSTLEDELRETRALHQKAVTMGEAKVSHMQKLLERQRNELLQKI